MKRLLSIIVLAAIVAMSLVSCKPDTVKLHEAVGTLYDSQTATSVSNPTMGGDGIVFFVNESENYALICSMNDLCRDRQENENLIHLWETDFTWSVFGQDTVMERDTIMAKVTRGIRHYIGSEDSAASETTRAYGEIYTKYRYDVVDSVIVIHPMLRYKAYTESGVQVCPPFTKDTLYTGFAGELIAGKEKVLGRVNLTEFRPRGADTGWTAEKVRVEGKDIAIAIGAFTSTVDTVWARVKDSVVEKRVKVWTSIADHYADTLWCGIKKGDRMVLENNKGVYTLDTNWCYGLIPDLDDNSTDGSKNTDMIVNADVPVKQAATPDSSSAARVCRQYFTRAYVAERGAFAADTVFQSTKGEWFLPSRSELKALYDARTKINETHANTLGFEPLQNCYWTSNQRGATMAYYKCFTANGIESYIPKANNNYRVNIRAVRKVKWPLEKK